MDCNANIINVINFLVAQFYILLQTYCIFVCVESYVDISSLSELSHNRLQVTQSRILYMNTLDRTTYANVAGSANFNKITCKNLQNF